MEFSDIELNHSDTKRSNAASDVNTVNSTESVAHTTTPNSGDTGENEGHYEKLRFGTKKTEADRNASRSIRWKDIPNRIKYAVYVIIAAIVVLYVVDIVVIVLIALPNSKVDGNWADWSMWSDCDVSCSSGTCTQTRKRTCNNPAPGNGGLDCSGSSTETKHCQKDVCPDGGWSGWGSWGLCSDSCGGGVRSRLRTCTNPRPSVLGRHCDGSSEKVMPCNRHTCSEHKVAFTVYGSTSGTSSATIRFPSTILNIGGGYSTSTGRFTCKTPGIYNFAVTLTKQRRDIDQINAYLQVNGSYKLQLHSDPVDSDNIDFGSYSLSVTGNFHLNKNDYVDVFGSPGSFYTGYRTSFTGVLVIPDE